MNDTVAIALSEKSGEGAVREASLKIKATFPKIIKALYVFFTPHYQPSLVYSTVQYTLKPQLFLGIQAPCLIYQDRIIEKGIVVCCINKNDVYIKPLQLKDDNPQTIESYIRMTLKNFVSDKQFFIPFLDNHYSCSNFLRALDLSVKKGCRVLGAGFNRTYGTKNYQIIQNTTESGLASLMGKGLGIKTIRISGLLPLGKPFTVTKVLHQKNIISEINGKPAAEIYRFYLEDKYPLFKKNALYSLYPIGLKKNGIMRIVQIIDMLEDGSLLCVGELNENSEGHIMMMHPATTLSEMERLSVPLSRSNADIAFVVNSTLRKNMYKDAAADEIQLLRKMLNAEIPMIGLYSDYALYSDEHTNQVVMEPGICLLSLWS